MNIDEDNEQYVALADATEYGNGFANDFYQGYEKVYNKSPLNVYKSGDYHISTDHLLMELESLSIVDELKKDLSRRMMEGWNKHFNASLDEYMFNQNLQPVVDNDFDPYNSSVSCDITYQAPIPIEFVNIPVTITNPKDNVKNLVIGYNNFDHRLGFRYNIVETE